MSSNPNHTGRGRPRKPDGPAARRKAEAAARRPIKQARKRSRRPIVVRPSLVTASLIGAFSAQHPKQFVTLFDEAIIRELARRQFPGAVEQLARAYPEEE